MKTFTLTLLLSISTLLSMAYTGNTYTVAGETRTFTNKLDMGRNNLLYDCYTEDGENIATAVSYYYPSLDNLYASDLDKIEFIIPSEVTFNGKKYTVRYIADKAFTYFTSSTYCLLRFITIPSTVWEIGDEAFSGMGWLTKVTMGDNVTYMGKKAFYNCASLSVVKMSNSVRYLGDQAFASCPNLESVILPSTIEYIGRYVFQNSPGLKYVEWDLNPDRWDLMSMLTLSLYIPDNAVIHTKTRKQAETARFQSKIVVSDEDKAYIESLEKAISDKDKTIAENNTMAENLVAQYTMMQQESQILQAHNNYLNNCDVNQDGQVNGTDVVTIYNRIIQGGTASYNGQPYVDLGLPSGTLWATCNVGAPSPECVGDYFAWGENGFYSYRYGLAFGKVEFTEKTYNPAPGAENITEGEWPQEYSPLKVIYISQWEGWKIPNRTQADELLENCTQTVVTINGQECVELTSKINKNKIYFPLNGKIYGTSAIRTDDAFYWTSTAMIGNGYILPFHLLTSLNTGLKHFGMGIRPVITKDDITE